MNKDYVYICVIGWIHEGYDIAGIYDNETNAREFIENYNPGSCPFDYLAIYKATMNSSYYPLDNIGYEDDSKFKELCVIMRPDKITKEKFGE